MCGRYVLYSTPEQLVGAVRRRTGQQRVAMVGEGPRENYNIAPTHTVPVLRPFRGVPTLGPAVWGYPPKTVFNARGETAFDKLTFAGSEPCVFVMDGWYEWTADEDPAPGDRRKQPWFTHAGGEPIFIAGLCKAVDGVVYATMVTTAATPELEWLHHRMPRVLVPGEGSGASDAGDVGGPGGTADEVRRWLEGDEATLRAMAAVPPTHGLGGLVSEKADKAVGNVANNGPGLISR